MTASQLFFRRKEMPGSLDKGISKSVSAAHEVRYGRQYEEGFARDRQAQDSYPDSGRSSADTGADQLFADEGQLRYAELSAAEHRYHEGSEYHGG